VSLGIPVNVTVIDSESTKLYPAFNHSWCSRKKAAEFEFCGFWFTEKMF
jgi:hypothetical protein